MILTMLEELSFLTSIRQKSSEWGTKFSEWEDPVSQTGNPVSREVAVRLKFTFWGTSISSFSYVSECIEKIMKPPIRG